MEFIENTGSLPINGPGFDLFREHKYEQALGAFEEEYKTNRSHEARQYLKYYIGKCYFFLGNYPKAKRYFLSVNKSAGDIQDQDLRFRNIANLAVIEVAQGNYEKGLSIYERFIPLYEKKSAPNVRCNLYCNAALALIKLNRMDEASEMIGRAEESAAVDNSPVLQQSVLYYKGVLESRQNRMSAGIKLLKKALAISEELEDFYFTAKINWQLGNIYLRKGSIDKSLTFLKRAIRISKKNHFRIETAKCLNDYAWALYRKESFLEAKKYAEEAIRIGKEVGLPLSKFIDTQDKISMCLDEFQEEDALISEIERESAREFGIIGISDGITAVIDSIKIFAASSDPVLIIGETGTGKELVAHALYSQSDRVNRPYIKRNCAAIPENLMESELFGHVKGAFTGATSDRKGIFAEANGGTLFLDEIGEMPISLQAKLLRVLESGEFYPIGSTELQKVNVRIITATNRRLYEAARKGDFREDLYYRLNTIKVTIPPLRERREDIPILINHFLYLLNDRYEKYYKRFAEEAYQLLNKYPFPGNVRELKNIVTASYLASSGRVVRDMDLERFMHLEPVSEDSVAEVDESGENVVPFEAEPIELDIGLKEYAARAEKEYILEVLKQASSVNNACEILKISRPTFYQKLKLYGININSKRLV